MARPDLSTAEGKARYRAELLRVGRGGRYIGLAMVGVALAGMIASRMHGAAMLGSRLGIASLALMVLGWVVLFAVIAVRTRYHRRRMAE